MNGDVLTDISGRDEWGLVYDMWYLRQSQSKNTILLFLALRLGRMMRRRVYHTVLSEASEAGFEQSAMRGRRKDDERWWLRMRNTLSWKLRLHNSLKSL